MTRKEQKKFVRDLTHMVRDRLLARIDQVPEEWDGIELRQLIADTFAVEARSLSMTAGLTLRDKRRRRDYKNECLVRNLI